MGKTVWLTRDGPYPCNIGYCPTQKAFNRSWRETTDADAPDIHCQPNGARAWYNPSCKNGLLPTYLICVEPGSFGVAETAAMVAHEAVHVVQWLWDQIGEEAPGAEAEAYMVQWITRGVLRAMGY